VTIAADARVLVTGFGSVRVQAGTVVTRGLLDDEDNLIEVGDGSTAVVRTRALLLVGEDVPVLARESTVSIGTLASDQDLTDYRVVDIQRQADGIVWRVLVAA
jgi:siroheme synthase (precorrin-2 oxidase/ferrochelatase)